MASVSKVKIENDLKQAIAKAVEEIGGFGKFINKGEVVFLKPNFNTADPFPASTDRGFLKAVVELVYECGAKLVMIGESSTMTLNSRKVMEQLDIFSLEKAKLSPRIYPLEGGEWVKKEIPQGKYLESVHLPEILDRADKVIFLPCLKTHKYAQFTGSLKLAVGLMKPIERVGLHARNLQEKIAELNTLFRLALIIMDARKCFINQGPSEGELAEPELILASENRVAIDVEGIKIIQSYKNNSLAGIDPWQLPQIKRAVELGLGPEN